MGQRSAFIGLLVLLLSASALFTFFILHTTSAAQSTAVAFLSKRLSYAADAAEGGDLPMYGPTYRRTQTKIPIYYMNLSGSTKRREAMEATFSSWGSLTRVEAVDGSSAKDVEENIETRGLDHSKYAAKVLAHTINEVALAATAYKALKLSFNRGDDVMLLLEDDMSDLLVPYWVYSLEDVVSEASRRDPLWDVIQLHMIVPDSPYVFHMWKKNSSAGGGSGMTLERYKGKKVWGGGAQLFSRKGVEKFLRRFGSKGGGGEGEEKFDCLNEVRRWSRKHFRCISEYMYFYQPKDWHSYLKVPPMFTFKLNEGSTHIRQTKAQEEGKEQVDEDSEPRENDHFRQHYTSIFQSLQANMEASAVAALLRDEVNQTADSPPPMPQFITRKMILRVF